MGVRNLADGHRIRPRPMPTADHDKSASLGAQSRPTNKQNTKCTPVARTTGRGLSCHVSTEQLPTTSHEPRTARACPTQKRQELQIAKTPAISRPFSRASARALSSLIAPKARRHTPSGNRRASARRWPPCYRGTALTRELIPLLVTDPAIKLYGKVEVQSNTRHCDSSPTSAVTPSPRTATRY